VQRRAVEKQGLSIRLLRVDRVLAPARMNPALTPACLRTYRDRFAHCIGAFPRRQRGTWRSGRKGLVRTMNTPSKLHLRNKRAQHRRPIWSLELSRSEPLSLQLRSANRCQPRSSSQSTNEPAPPAGTDEPADTGPTDLVAATRPTDLVAADQSATGELIANELANAFVSDPLFKSSVPSPVPNRPDSAHRRFCQVHDTHN
jgi:hypothetical protein